MISKRARYALHGVGYLAYRHQDTPVPFAHILDYLRRYSSKLTLSPGYISKIFQDLSRAGIVHASVGCKGGYALARNPRDVAIVEVVSAVDGRPVEQCCMLSVGDCDNQGDCGVYEVVCKAQAVFYDFLAGESALTLSRKMFGRRPPGGLVPARRARRRGVASGVRRARGAARQVRPTR